MDDPELERIERVAAAAVRVELLPVVALDAILKLQPVAPGQAVVSFQREEVVGDGLLRRVDAVRKRVLDERPVPPDGTLQVAQRADVAAPVDAELRRKAAGIEFDVQRLALIPDGQSAIVLFEGRVADDVIGRVGIPCLAHAALHAPTPLRRSTRRPFEEQRSGPLTAIREAVQREVSAHAGRRRQHARLDADDAADGADAVLDARRAFYDFDPGRGEGVDLGRVLAAPLLPLLRHAVVQHDDALAVQAAHDGLRNRRTRLHGGDAGELLQRLAERLPTGSIEHVGRQRSDGLAGAR